MRFLPASFPAASQLALLIFLISSNALRVPTITAHDAHVGASPKLNGDEKGPIQPSTQPFSTQPITNHLSATNTTIPRPPLHTIRLLELHTILTTPETERSLFRAMERMCEVFAYYLLDLDLLDEQDLALRFGEFTLEFYDLAGYLSMLAVKAVVMKLMQMVTMGLLGFFRGEMIDAQAGVRMIFAFDVLRGGHGDWELRKRSAGENGMISSFHG